MDSSSEQDRIEGLGGERLQKAPVQSRACLSTELWMSFNDNDYCRVNLSVGKVHSRLSYIIHGHGYC